MFDRAIVTRLLCVAVVAAIMLPLGCMLFPYVSHELKFYAIEAVISATVGFSISAIIS